MSQDKSTQDVLQALLAAEEDIQKKVYMERFKIDFVVKALTQKEMNKITERATKVGKKGKRIVNDELFNQLVIAEACIVPNWHDKDLLEGLGVYEAKDAIEKKLLFGEAAKLIGEIGELNGFNQSDEDQIEEVKN